MNASKANQSNSKDQYWRSVFNGVTMTMIYFNHQQVLLLLQPA
jgi:hypothetical protein